MLNILEVQPTIELQERWTVDSQEKAAWALRKLRKLRQAQAENGVTGTAIIRELQSEIEATAKWVAEQNEDLEKEASFFISSLETYHRKLMEENPKQKTVKLPFGTLKLRAQQPEYIRDAVILLDWAKASRPDAVKVVESADWATIKKSVVVRDGMAIDTTSGEIVDGVTVEEREPKFEVVTD